MEKELPPSPINPNPEKNEPSFPSEEEYFRVPTEAEPEKLEENETLSGQRPEEMDPETRALIELDPSYGLNGADYAADYLADLHVELAPELEKFDRLGVDHQAVADTGQTWAGIVGRVGEQGEVLDRDVEMLSGLESTSEVKIKRAIDLLDLAKESGGSLNRAKIEVIQGDLLDVKRRLGEKRFGETRALRAEPDEVSATEKSGAAAENRPAAEDQSPSAADAESSPGPTAGEGPSFSESRATATSRLVNQVTEALRQARNDGQRLLKAIGRPDAGPFMQGMADTSALLLNGSEQALRALGRWLKKRGATPEADNLSRVQKMVRAAEAETQSRGEEEKTTRIRKLDSFLEKRTREEAELYRVFLDNLEARSAAGESIEKPDQSPPPAAGPEATADVSEGVFAGEEDAFQIDPERQTPEEIRMRIETARSRYQQLQLQGEGLRQKIEQSQRRLKRAEKAAQHAQRTSWFNQKGRQRRSDIEWATRARQEELEQMRTDLREVARKMGALEQRIKQWRELIVQKQEQQRAQWRRQGLGRRLKNRLSRSGRAEIKKHRQAMSDWGGLLNMAAAAGREMRGESDFLLKIADELANSALFK